MNCEMIRPRPAPSADLTLDLGARNQRRDRVDDDHVDRAASDQHFSDFEGFLAGLGLTHKELFEVDAALPGPGGVQPMLGVHDRGHSASPLRAGGHMQRKRRFT